MPRYLLESGSPDGYLLEDGGGVLLDEALLALTDGLISYWKSDETSGSLLDARGSNTLAAVNAPGTATGKIGNSRSYARASEQYFSIASNASLVIPNNTTSYEFGHWIRISSTSNNKQTITKRTNTQIALLLEYMLRIDGDVPTLYWGVMPDSFGSLAGASLSINTWYYLTFGYDASTSRFFQTRDAGAPIFSSTVTNQTVNETNPFQIGGSVNVGSNEDLDGLIDEILFRKGFTLSGAERTQLWNDGNGLAYPFVTETQSPRTMQQMRQRC